MTPTLIFFAVLLTLCAYVALKWRQRLNYWQQRGIPCEEPHILYGNSAGAQTTRTFSEIWQSYYNKFKETGPFAGFYWFQWPAVFVLEPSLAKQILIKDFNKFTDRGFFTNERDDPLSGQLFLLRGHKWRMMRNKLSPTFTSGKMKCMFPTVIGVGKELVRVGAELVAVDGTLEVCDLMGRFTMDVIGSCAFGLDCNSLRNPNAQFRTMAKRAFIEHRYGRLGMIFFVSFPELARKLRLKQTPQDIEDFFVGLVRETVAYRESSELRRNDFMHLLIDLKNNKLLKSPHGDELTNITLEELAAQAFTFLVAGFETSSTTLGFALYELAQHEHIQERARLEVAKVLAQHDGELSYECMKELQYLEQIISETLRLYTIVPILNRYSLEDYEIPGHPKYKISKGMSVIIPCGAMHHDARYYPNPEQFNPDNFTPEKVQQRDSVEWLAFGEGPRNCIGMRFGLMQTRIGLALLLHHFKFSVCAQTQIPLTFNKQAFLLNSEHGIYLRVEKI